MPKRISDIDWSQSGGFGLPYNYAVEELAKRARNGELEPTEEQWNLIENWAKLKTAAGKMQIEDPLTWGWRLRAWEKALEYLPKSKVLFLAGGKRSSKTELLSRVANMTLLELPESYISIWGQNDKMSTGIVQDKVFRNLPMNWRGVELKSSSKKKGDDFSMTWSQKNGFSDNILIVPPMHELQIKGSEMHFKTYSQYQNDKQIAESYSSDLECFDEEPFLDLFKAAQARTTERDGKILWACTLVKGYGELAAYVLDGAETLETHHSDWINEDLPLVQKSKTLKDCYIIYFPTEWNPFNDWEATKKSYSGLTLEEKRIWAYGCASKRSLTQFPRLNVSAHIYTDKTENQPDNKDCTHYMWCDPAGKKRWVMLWAKVDKQGEVWIEREWPDLQNYGPWALPSQGTVANKFKGSEGPAQNEGMEVGMGYESYCKKIKQIERQLGWSEGDRSMVFQRRIDPRGNKTLQGATGATNTITEMAKLGIFFLKAEGPNEIDPGIQMINSYLDYDPNRPVDSANHPKLHIHKRCGNLWSCLQMYNGHGGPEEHAKDFVDVLRYGLMSGPINIGTGKLGIKSVKRS